MAGTTVRRQRYARRGARPPARLHLGVGQRSGIRAGSRPSSGKLARSRLTGSFIPPRTAARVAYGSPAQPVPLQGGEIGCPQGIAVLADLAQVAPGVDAGIVQVVEYDPDGVVALRDQFHDPDMAAPGHDPLLSRPVSHHLGGRTFDTKEFGRGGEGASVVEVDFQQLLRRFQTDLHRPAVGATRPVHVAASGAGSSRYRASSISKIGRAHV